MIKTIKVKKQLRLDELIEYAFDNDVKDTSFNSSKGAVIYFDKQGGFTLGDIFSVKKASTFAVEVEEPITESTVFRTLVDVNNNDEVHIAWNDSINLYDKEQTKEIHALINGKLELIYERNDGNSQCTVKR